MRWLAHESAEAFIKLLLLASCLPCFGGASEAAGTDLSHIRHRCKGVKGSWCRDFLTQTQTPWKAPPKHKEACPNDCGGIGNCLANIGKCDCPAGWTGRDCTERQRRPCTNRWRESASIQEPVSSTNLSDIGWTASRCAGICDEDVGLCFCNGTQGRIHAPAGSPHGALPLQEGRPMLEARCAPDTDDFGGPSFGVVPANDLYGPEGWCEAAQPKKLCPCILDGLAGSTCELKAEMFCINQCSGHGDCKRGWCKCHDGYYGTDCAHLKEGAAKTEEIWKQQPALKDLTKNFAAEDPPSKSTRPKPLIYIYDLPSMYNSRMLQYRPAKELCTYRTFLESNDSAFTSWTYAIETAFHEMLAQSPHRTLNPEEADFFYAPVYTSCFAHPIYGWADFPWFHGIAGPRTMQMSNMLLQAKQWLQQAHPYWNQTGGRNHIFLASHDEGSCWVPEELRPAIILSHWGRKDKEHTSGTAYEPDNYSADWIVPEISPLPWHRILGKVPCYDPKKDLVIPALRPPQLWESPLIGSPSKERSMLAFFRGDFRNDNSPKYSRGIRQRLRHLAMQGNWAEKYRIYIGTALEIPGEYGDLFTQSTFCLVLPGDGYSSRASDSILNGCLPVVIMDNVDAAFESILDWNLFSIRINESEIDRLPTILLNLPEQQVTAMQHALSHVWHRFAYTSLPLYQKFLEPVIEANRLRYHGAPRSLPGPQFGPLKTDDAFGTIISWLHSKI